MDETFEIIKAGAPDALPEQALYRIQQTYPDGSGGRLGKSACLPRASHTFKTEEAAFIHQFRDCSQEVRDPDRVPGCPSSPDETCAGCMMRGRCWKGDDDE